MSVKKVRGKWEVSVYLPGNSRNRNRRYRRRYRLEKVARRIENKLQVAIADGTYPRVLKQLSRPTRDEMFCSVADDYFEEYCQAHNKDTSTKAYRLGVLKECFGSLAVTEITPIDVQKYPMWRKKHIINRKVSNATINRELAVLRHLFNWGMRNGLVESNPCDQVENLHEASEDLHKPTDEVIDAVFAELPEYHLPVFDFIRYTGCRKNEALSLTWDQLRLKDRKAILSPNHTKSRNWRYLFLTTGLVEMLEHLPRLQGCPYVFYNPHTRTRWYDLKKAWDTARKKAGYPWLKIKDLRRAYGIKLAESGGVEMHHIQKALGHSSVKVTEGYYAHYSADSSQDRVLRVLEGGKS